MAGLGISRTDRCDRFTMAEHWGECARSRSEAEALCRDVESRFVDAAGRPSVQPNGESDYSAGARRIRPFGVVTSVHCASARKRSSGWWRFGRWTTDGVFEMRIADGFYMAISNSPSSLTRKTFSKGFFPAIDSTMDTRYTHRETTDR